MTWVLVLLAEQAEIEAEIEALRREQKVLVGKISEKSGGPEGCGPQLLQSYLSLKDES